MRLVNWQKRTDIREEDRKIIGLVYNLDEADVMSRGVDSSSDKTKMKGAICHYPHRQ